MQRGPSVDGLRKPEVCDFDDGRIVVRQEDVLRFEVSVDDVFAVEVVERERDFGRVELRYGIWEALHGR